MRALAACRCYGAAAGSEYAPIFAGVVSVGGTKPNRSGRTSSHRNAAPPPIEIPPTIRSAGSAGPPYLASTAGSTSSSSDVSSRSPRHGVALAVHRLEVGVDPPVRPMILRRVRGDHHERGEVPAADRRRGSNRAPDASRPPTRSARAASRATGAPQRNQGRSVAAPGAARAGRAATTRPASRPPPSSSSRHAAHRTRPVCGTSDRRGVDGGRGQVATSPETIT